MRVAVLGGGFGLYGWLPALCSATGLEVATLHKYRSELQRRPELREFIDRTTFWSDEDSLIRSVDALVFARRPIDQIVMVERLVRTAWSGVLVLEKPLGPTPATAADMLSRLEHCGIKVLVGFSIAETAWARELTRRMQTGRELRLGIDWRFMANHYAKRNDSWKSRPAEGGGALRFYAIHLVGWLAQESNWATSFCSPWSAKDDDPSVGFQVMRPGQSVSIRCDSRSGDAPIFKIVNLATAETGPVVSLADPLSEDDVAFCAGQDRRVAYIARIVQRLAAGQALHAGALRQHVRLWDELEAARAFPTD